MTKLPLFVLLLLTVASSGCGTAVNLAIDTKIPYGGTLADGGIVVASVKGGVDLISGETPQRSLLYAPILAPFALIDLPFSFVADTLLLPYTITACRRKMVVHEAEVAASEAAEAVRIPVQRQTSPIPDPPAN